MDKKTFAQFLMFSAAVLVVWWAASYFMFRRAPAQAPVPPAALAQPPAERPGPGPAPRLEAPDDAQAPAIGEAPPAPAPEPVPEPQTARLANGRIATRWTNRGAGLMQLDLLDERYRAPYRVDGERPVLTLLRDFQEGTYSDVIESVTFYEPSPEGTLQPLQSGVSDNMYEVTEPGANRLAFATVVRDRQGHALAIRKDVAMPPDASHYSVELEFENVAAEPCEFSFALRGPAGIQREVVQSRYLATCVGIQDGPDDFDIKKKSGKSLRKEPYENHSPEIAWAGVVNHYFATVVLPEDAGWISHVASRSVTDTDILRARGRWGPGTVGKESQRAELARSNATVVLHSIPRKLAPGEKVTVRYRMLAAPKVDEALEGYDAGLPGLIDFGILPSVSRLALALLKAIHSVLPNYGVAIILLTIFVRTLLHPLTRKSQVSMAKMQKVQPLMAELQKKHAGDKQKLTQEQMELWRKYGVSPMSGCFPMLLQMPVLIALFGALRASIELRHASFLWVDDLSGPDTLFYLPFQLPFLGNEFNLLPILMAAAMVLSQRHTPTAGTDQARQQQAMMKFMPIMFAVLFYHFPSGLCLYILTSTGVGLLERWLVNKQTAGMELKPVAVKLRKDKRRKPGPRAADKPTWLDRLQKMVDPPGRKGRPPKGGR